MVAGFPTRIERRNGKTTSFVRAGAHDEDAALFTSKVQAEKYAKFQREMNGIKTRLQKVSGGYYVWLEWKRQTRRKKSR